MSEATPAMTDDQFHATAVNTLLDEALRQLAQRDERIERLEEMLVHGAANVIHFPGEYQHAIDDIESAFECSTVDAATLLLAAGRKFQGVRGQITDWPSAALSPSGEAGAEAGA